MYVEEDAKADAAQQKKLEALERKVEQEQEKLKLAEQSGVSPDLSNCAISMLYHHLREMV